MLPYGEPGRKALAIQIANDPGQLEARLGTLLQALISNNPVIFYSGFSTEKNAPIHLILVIGYAYITDDSGRHLWLAVADPATHGNKISPRKGAAIFFPPTAEEANDVDAVAARKLTHEHDFIRVIPGAWEEAQGALVLIRARKLFEENPFSRVDDLFMDYWGDGAKGGTFLYSHKQTRVPPEFVYTNVTRSVSLPLDGQQSRIRPVNGYVTVEQSEMGFFPFGGHRTLHSGIHLERAHFPERPPPPSPPKKPEEPKKSEGTKAPPTGQREVRCLAPGHIVALRLANALPAAESSVAAQKGSEKNKLAQELVGNHNSFVLVRHDVEVIQARGEEPPSGQSTPERFTFYSLYMHLMPPDWKDAHTYRDVAWLKTLARREGSLVVVDPRNPAFGQVRWIQPPSEASNPPQEDIVLKSGGLFSVIGAGLGLPEEFNLGEGTEGVSAVWRKPDRDVTELHEALIAGKVVTLPHPYLMVRAGEVLGYLDEKSQAAGDGFLHWEILAPSQESSLEKLLKFAERKLKLSTEGAPFFKFFEEKDRNNFFEPVEDKSGTGNEVIDQVLALAPESKHASGPDYENLKHFRSSYSEETLQKILATYTTLPFSAEEPESSKKGLPDEPSYPVDLLITNYKDSLPKGAYQLKLTFEPPSRELLVDYDGKQTHLRIRLPANARKVFVEPADSSRLLLQTGSGGGQDALKRDAAHFKNVASMRWRNLVLRHLNAWHPEGIAKQVDAQLRFYKELQIGKSLVTTQDEEKAASALKELSEVVGWWSHQETVVLGTAGQEKPLFAEQPDSEQLPQDTLLDNPHPVTFAWLLMLLTHHGLVRFADTQPWLSDEAKTLSAIGWVPALPEHPPMRVGAHIYLAAIQRGGATESVPARVAHGARTYELPLGKAREGAVMYPLELPGWGSWKLDASGAKALGGLELTGQEPVLLSTRDSAGLTSHEDGSFSWRIAFRDHLPKIIQGWVLLRVASAEVPKKPAPKQGKQKPGAEAVAATQPLEFQVATVAIPVEGRESLTRSEARGFQLIDGYVKRGEAKDAGTYVSQHFTYKAFIDAAAKDTKGAASAEPLLAWELVDAVERIQCLYGPRQALALTALSAEGLSITLMAGNPEVLRQVVAQAKNEGWIADAEEAGKGSVLIRVKEPRASQHPGELVIEFDAHEAFSALRKTIPAEKRLVVQFGCLFPNGGHLHDPRLSRTETLGKRAEEVDVEELRRQASAGHLELWSTVDAEDLHPQPSFGIPKIQLTAKGIQITVPLLGADARFWTAAGAYITLGQQALDEKATSTLQTTPQGLYLVRQVPLGTKGLQDVELQISAAAKNKRVPLQSERIDVDPSDIVVYDTQRGAELELKPRPDDPFMLGVFLKTFGVPSGRGFTLELLTAPDKKGGKPQPLKLAKNTLVYKSMVKAGSGVTRSDGILQAEVNLREVAVALPGGQRFTVRAVPLDKKDVDLRTEAEGSLPEPIHQPAFQDAPSSFHGMWPEDGGGIPMKSEGL
ncbi:MAG: hypothetical protein ABW123_15090 [Cystobacter sp.]